MVWRTAKYVMNHMLKENVGLIAARSNKSQEMNHFFCTKYITEAKTGESTTQSCLFPLYLYKNEGNAKYIEFESLEKEDNFQDNFKKTLKVKYEKEYTPDEILGYIYAIMYSSIYREKYRSFIRLDFPRIPFIDSRHEFEKLFKIGLDLIQTHMMEKIPNLAVGDYKGEGNHEVVKVVLRNDKLFINNTQYFDNVSLDIYQFQIGGYKILKKYLDYRKGKPLDINEIENVENCIKVIAYTIERMKSIDKNIKNWI